MTERETEIYYTIALSQIPMLGHVSIRKLISKCGSAQAIFNKKKQNLLKISGIRKNAIDNLLNVSDDVFKRTEEEMDFIAKNNIQTYLLTDNDYPKRLKYCADAPAILFAKGKINFNVDKVVAIVGTRNASRYGYDFTKQLIADLSDYGILIVSGLALGIDTISHESAVKNGMQTIGVLGHGLHMIYPSSNRKLAANMLSNGGILTEYFSGTMPDMMNFPNRNRIIAGLSDAVVVVEARKNGGALITANLAFSYDRDVFAVPGKVNDDTSEGCNDLIKSNKAALISSAKDVIALMNWDVENKVEKKQKQRQLFIDLSEKERLIANLISDYSEIDIDTLLLKTEMDITSLSTLLLSLECKNYLECLPGKRYRIL